MKEALRLFIKLKQSYLKFNIKPCFIIQISNTELGLKQLDIVKNLLSSEIYNNFQINGTNINCLCEVRYNNELQEEGMDNIIEMINNYINGLSIDFLEIHLLTIFGQLK